MAHITQKNTDTFVGVGTSLQGYIVATRAQIASVFGEPTFDLPSADEKVTTEWIVVFDSVDEDDIVATIYDWKRYEMGKPQSDEKIVWHIGGRTYDAVTRVADALSVDALAEYPFGI
jgi:hypothetical protein